MKKVKTISLMSVIAVTLVAILAIVFLLNYKKIETSHFNYKEASLNDSEKSTILSSQIKKYNLSLFEFVSAISKDENIEEGEYLTDTGKQEGNYLRAPTIKKIESNQIIYEKNSKDALEIKSGDYILYTTRIYNEGNTDAYASKITKTLPIGLEFITTNEEYNGIWNLEGFDQDGRQKITTTWIAKGQGEEINSIEGDYNYKHNLIKRVDKEISFIEVQVLCKVTEEETRVLVNYSELIENTDAEGSIIQHNDLNIEEDNLDIERIRVIENSENKI